MYHKLNFALIGLGPLALALPSGWTFPVDLALGVIIPLHSHLGVCRANACCLPGAWACAARHAERVGHTPPEPLNDVITDYAKKITKAKWFEHSLRGTALGMTVVAFFGLLKLNLQVRSNPQGSNAPPSADHAHENRL
eukprot:2691543-Prymnesium_polylepis.1